MGKIYCLMGKSASGKDTVYRKILERLPELGTYVMYTTRPMREGEIPGRTYHYIEAEELDALSRQGKVIESRTYSTGYGPWTYATVDDGPFDLESGDYLVPGTPESFVRLKAYFGAERVVPLLLEVEDGERLLRAVRREQREARPKYEELCRRFLADAADFSEEKLREAGISRRFVNEDPDRCAAEIAEEIRAGG
jgi:guanylate kinase